MKTPILLVALLAILRAAPAGAQVLTRPHLEWRTARTEHFTVHYPRELEAWTMDVLTRLEPAHAQVSALVGFAPRARTTIVVEDPSSQTNGFAFPLLDGPAIGLWPTPPDPRSVLGNSRGFAEKLVVHEFAHVAHLSRPSRNARQRLLWRLSPLRVGPVARKAPRWVTEGYATYVEGALTGSGRPYSVIRAAVLRQWALEGRLPSYGQLDATGGFYGGAMAYLAGSAYLEWLAAQRGGDSSLVNLWRRMSARQDRTFPAAFSGVFGAAPHELYGRFTVDVTERALAARTALEAAGIVEGDTVQRLSWSTGDPAVSRDGQHLAIVLRGAPGTPSRVVVWKTADEPGDSAAAAAAARLLARDPEDVPDVRGRPRPKRAIATLFPVDGRGHDDPRFLPDGSGILVTRSEPRPDGATRPDLFVWSWRKGGALRRVTRGASIHSADPAPDGRSAAAVRCLYGRCDLVRVDLASGAVTTLAEGGQDAVFYRPRFSPDGRSIAVAVQREGTWGLMLADAATSALRAVAVQDGASRYDAAWLADGRLVAVSERGGVANLAIIDPATGAETPLTRVTGAAVAPEPAAGTGHVFYLSLHAGGMDLMRVHPDSARPGPVVALDAALAPAAPRVAAAVPDTLPRTAVPPSRGYGLGPRRIRLLPMSSDGQDGGVYGGTLVGTDPIGRFTWLLNGVGGEEGTPRGVSLNLLYRGWRPAVGLDLFSFTHDPSELGPGEDGFTVDQELDASYLGGALSLEYPYAGTPSRWRARAGGSAGSLQLGNGDGDVDRLLAYAEQGVAFSRSRGRQSISGSLWLHGSAGRTGEDDWRRGVATGTLGVGLFGFNARGQVTYGRVNDNAPRWERFTAGGIAQPLFDRAILSQRLPMPAARFGVVEGSELLQYRASTGIGGLTAYYWGATADPDRESWYRVAGVETTQTVESIGIIGLPAFRFTAGVGYPLDAPDRHELNVYTSITFRP
ncbi:MAG TPA: hypothetical protein VFR81_21235 [Longimicrobium sp.]|nr:hypothetical protein [Longimicrobium sp.]